MQVQIDNDLADRIRAIADNNGISIKSYVNGLLETAVMHEMEEPDSDCKHENLMSYTEDGLGYRACRDCQEIWEDE
jgi:hypothetical protein